MPGWVSAQDLRLSLGPVTYMAIFDDAPKTKDITAVDASDQVALVLDDSAADVKSYLPSLFNDLAMPPELPAASSKLLRGAQLIYAKVLSYQRHPEYVKTYGAQHDGPMEKRYREMMSRIQSAIQRIPATDSPPLEQPANVSTVVRDDGRRIILTEPDGDRNLGDF